MEGLQIERYSLQYDTDGQGDIAKTLDGPYCLFSDAEKFHTQLQKAIDKNMKLTAERDQLVDALKDTAKWIAKHFTPSQASVHADGPCGQGFCIYCKAVKLLKAAGEEI